MSSKGTVRKLNALLELSCFQMEGERRFEASDATRSTSIAALDANFRSDLQRPPVLRILVTGALSGAGIVLAGKSYVPLGSCAPRASYSSANVVKKGNRRRWNV
jgi:hypothetical protein